MITKIAEASSTHPTSATVTVPYIHPRTAVTNNEIGLISTNPCNKVGSVSGSTNTLLTNVNGNKTIILTIIRDFSERMIMPSVVQIQDRLKQKIKMSPNAERTPMKPPSGLNPNNNPRRTMIVDAMNNERHRPLMLLLRLMVAKWVMYEAVKYSFSYIIV